MYWFLCAIHASMNLKKFSSSKLDKFILFTYSFVGWNLQNLCKQAVSIFFWLSWHFKWENPYFGKHLLAKQELIARLRVQDFVTGKKSSFNQGTTKSFAFLLGNVILYTRGVGRILDSYANLRRSLGFAQLSRILPTPLCKHGKRFLLLN